MAILDYSVPSLETRFEKSMAYNKKAGYTTLKVKNDEYRLFVCTDTHIKDSTNTLRKFVQLYHDDSDCPAAIHLGDLIVDVLNLFCHD